MWGKPKTEENSIQCSLVKSPVVYLEPTPRQKIQLLMNEYSHQEWLAYLVGSISEKGNIFVEDIIVPPHEEASGASAEAEPLHIPKSCVGVIHSHHTMGTFHSATDQAYVDKNFPVSITVARRDGELTFDAVSYQQTPCGKSLTLKSVVKYVQPQLLFNGDKFLKKAKENIDKNKKVYTPMPHYGYQGEYPYIPVGYRFPSLGDVVVDKNGRVIPQRELEDILRNSTEG